MKLSNEAKVGIFVSAVLAMLAVLTVKTGNFDFSSDGYQVKVNFKNVDGIVLNAPVMLNGFEVGLVKKIDVVETQDDAFMQLTVWINEDVRLHEGSKAYVKNMGFMGEKYVGLTSGNVSAPALASDAVITGDEPADLDRILADGQDIAKNIKSISQNINERLEKNKEKIDQIVINTDTSMKNIASISANLDERLNVNKEHIDETFSHLHSSTVNLDLFTHDLKRNPWKLLYRSKEQREENIKNAQQ